MPTEQDHQSFATFWALQITLVQSKSERMPPQLVHLIRQVAVRTAEYFDQINGFSHGFVELWKCLTTPVRSD